MHSTNLLKSRFLLLLVSLTFLGCNGAGDNSKARAFDPCDGVREIDPHCGWKPHWYSTGVSTNAIDGTKKEHLSIDSTDADGIDFGRLHYAELKLCFENGKLCGHNIVGVGVTIHGMVESLSDANYSTPVRLKFDDAKPSRETWGISDSHDTLFPSGHEKQFLSQLMAHKKLVLEFSYYEKAPRTITFELSGLREKMQADGLQDPTSERQTKQRREEPFKEFKELRAKCEPFENGGPEQVQSKTMPLPPKECREVLPWMRDAYLDAPYDLQEKSQKPSQ